MFFIGLLMTLVVVFVIFVHIDDSVDCIGVIDQGEKYEVRAAISGLISDVYFHNGDNVSENDLIIKFNDEDILIELNKSILQYNIMQKKFEHNLSEAERLFESQSKLYKQNMISYSEYYQSKINYETVQLDKYDLEQLFLTVVSLSNQLQRTEIRSRSSGRLIYDESKLIAGNYINIGEKLFQVVNYENSHNIIAKILIPEELSSRINISNNVKIFITAYPYMKYNVVNGILYSISPVSENGFFTGKVYLNSTSVNVNGVEKNISIGMTLNAKIIVGKIEVYRYLLGMKEM